jgi:uncharacterized protein YdgA (DUF945 family)
MKKVILAVVLIGIVVVIGAPFANGLIMERVVKHACADINKLYADTGQGLSIEIADYKRGYGSSRIKWKIVMGKLQKIYGIEEIVVVDEAKHGYTGVISKSSLDENEWFKKFVDEKLNGKNPVAITTRYNLLGNIESTLVLDAFSLQDGDHVTEIKPGRMVFACTRGLKSFTSQATWGGLAVADQFNLDGVSFISDARMISSYIWDGRGSFKVEHAKATADDANIDVANLKCDFAMGFDDPGNTVSLDANYSADHFDTGEKRIENAAVRIGINKMDARGYENFMKVYTQIVNATMDTMEQTQDDPQRMQAAMQRQMQSNSLQFVAALEKILKEGLEIKISDLKATLPEGQIMGHINLGLKKDMTMAQFIPILGQPSLALDIFSLHSDMRLPASLAGDGSKLFTPLYPGMQTSLFLRQGDSMVHNAETRDGKLYLNGQEVFLDARPSV